MAPTYITALVMLVATLFPDVAPEAIQTTFETLIVIGGSVIILVRQLITKRATLLGGRPH